MPEEGGVDCLVVLPQEPAEGKASLTAESGHAEAMQKEQLVRELAAEKVEVAKPEKMAAEGYEDPPAAREFEIFSQWYMLEKVTFKLHYLCFAGGAASPCNTVIEKHMMESQMVGELDTCWPRFYCKCCQARWRTRFGAMILITFKGKTNYFLGSCEEMEVIRRRPQLLLDELPAMPPLEKNTFLTQALNRAGEPIKGHWKFNASVFRSRLNQNYSARASRGGQSVRTHAWQERAEQLRQELQ